MTGSVSTLTGRTPRRVSWSCDKPGCVSTGRAATQAEARLDKAAHHFAAHLRQLPSHDVPTGEVRGRDGDMVDVDLRAHTDLCEGGWLGEDIDGNRVPCLLCKPHLRPKYPRRIPAPVFRHDPPAPEPFPAKVARLLSDGHVHITHLTPTGARAVVEGDTGTYDVTWSADGHWSCTCAAGGNRSTCTHTTAVATVTRQPRASGEPAPSYRNRTDAEADPTYESKDRP